MPCDACTKKLQDLEAENKKLRLTIRELRDKLFAKNIEVNRMYMDTFESVEFGNGYDK